MFPNISQKSCFWKSTIFQHLLGLMHAVFILIIVLFMFHWFVSYTSYIVNTVTIFISFLFLLQFSWLYKDFHSIVMPMYSLNQYCPSLSFIIIILRGLLKSFIVSESNILLDKTTIVRIQHWHTKTLLILILLNNNWKRFSNVSYLLTSLTVLTTHFAENGRNNKVIEWTL